MTGDFRLMGNAARWMLRTKTNMHIQTSEYCAVGHADRTCDFIVAYILDRYLERDPHARVGLECQLKDTFATLSGEVSSAHHFKDEELSEFAHQAITQIGYTDDYRDKWGRTNTISGNDVQVTLHLSQQSPDIAQGVDADGWGDQGIFFGYAVRDHAHDNMPIDHWLARKVANTLYKSGWGGLDIKTQVTVEDGTATECVVAIPLLPANECEMKLRITDLVKSICGPKCEVIVNGTGRYVTHGSIGDCGTTGRKLVVNFYGGNSRIGGGCPWGKDPTKADVSLNILARRKALARLDAYPQLKAIQCAISCCIGRPDIRVTLYDDHGNLLDSQVERQPPSRVIEMLSLREPLFADRCRWGLFGTRETNH